MFKNDAAEFVYTRTYSRWIEDKNRRETWPETVDRFINFLREEKGDLIPKKVYRKIKAAMLNFEVMPSMRALWAAGEAARRDNTTMYNCSFIALDSVASFAECLYILMCGTGVGFSVEQKYVNKLPIVEPLTHNSPIKFTVPDDKAGWADAVKILMSNLYKGQRVEFDYSLIRPKGSRLVTMGGRSSGSEPLSILYRFIVDTFNKAQGRKLTPLECHDIANQIAEIVVVGGVRRSSQISLSDLNDTEMRDSKVWPFPLRRAMANNSAVYSVKPTATEFLKEWASLAASGTGERGIFNLESVRARAPERRNADLIAGTNPSLRAGTKVITNEGIFNIEDLEGKEFFVKNLNGELSSAKCFLSGKNKKLIKIKLNTGFEYYCTEEHKWPVITENGVRKVEAKNLKVEDKFPILKQDVLFEGSEGTYNDGFILGWLYGDGWRTIRSDNNRIQYGFIVSKDDQKYGIHSILEDYLFSITGNKFSGCNNKEMGHIEYNSTNSKLVAHFDKLGVGHKEEGLPKIIWRHGSENLRKGFVDGLFSSDGTVDINKKNVTLITSKRRLAEEVSELLGFYGIKTTINHRKYKSKFPNGKDYDKLYTSYRVSTKNLEDAKRFESLFSFTHKEKQKKLEDLDFVRKKGVPSDYVSIKELDKDTGLNEDVWDISVFDETHCFQLSHCITGNCGEIALRPMEFCNLSSVVVRPEDDLDSLLEKVESATWIGAIQSSFVKFPYLRRKWKQNCEEECLLGVSLSGQADNPQLLTPDVLKALKARATRVSKKAAKCLGINPPTAITCVKPEGSSSQVVVSGSGLHPWYSEYFIRRYRISANDPLCKMLQAQKIPMSPENGQSKDNVNTWVISFPVKASKGAKLRKDMTAIDQLEHYKKIQTNWCEHNASCTIYVKDSEWFEVGNWVYNNWDIINGVSFLPFDGGHYQQAPYEEITKEEYYKMVKSFPKIDYSKLKDFEKEDSTEGAKSLACVGDKCELQ